MGRWAVIVCVVLVQTSLIFWLLEVLAARWLADSDQLFIWHERLNHVWPANTSRRNPGAPDRDPLNAAPFEQYINSEGWLEMREFEREKPPNTLRIFYVGDSFVEGTVPMEKSLPAHVEAHVRRNLADSGQRVEVINAGVRSYSPVIYYIQIRYYLEPFDPDVVVLNIDMTDDFDDFKYRETLMLDDEGNPWAAPRRDIFRSAYLDTLDGPVALGPREKVQLWLYTHSNIFRYLLSSRPPPRLTDREFQDLLGYSRWKWVEHEWDEATEENVAFTLGMIGRIADYCRSAGIQLVLTAVPHYEQFVGVDGERRWSLRPHREIKRVAKAHGAVYLDAHAAMQARIDGTPQWAWYAKGDMHFNVRGYKLWADVQAALLMRNGFGFLEEPSHRR